VEIVGGCGDGALRLRRQDSGRGRMLVVRLGRCMDPRNVIAVGHVPCVSVALAASGPDIAT
jgi:hypothetical protein